MGTPRPQRAQVAATYDRGVDAYAAVWSPIILPPARSVVAALELGAGARVLDVGTGVGALVPSIRAAAANITVIGLDPSKEMLRVARECTALPAVRGDASSLPIRSGSVDAALLAFVLFHLSDPSVAMAEVTRVLAAGGRVGTVTWIRDDSIRAYDEWDAALTEAGAAPLGARRVDDGLNSREGIEALFTGSDLRATRIWSEDLGHQWDRPSYWALATGSGLNRLRLEQLEPGRREEALATAHKRMNALPLDAYAWRGQVLCAVATKHPRG